jgi:hypothetical protein
MYFQPRDVPVVKSPQSESIVWSSHDSANTNTNYITLRTKNVSFQVFVAKDKIKNDLPERRFHMDGNFPKI